MISIIDSMGNPNVKIKSRDSETIGGINIDYHWFVCLGCYTSTDCIKSPDTVKAWSYVKRSLIDK